MFFFLAALHCDIVFEAYFLIYISLWLIDFCFWLVLIPTRIINGVTSILVETTGTSFRQINRVKKVSLPLINSGSPCGPPYGGRGLQCGFCPSWLYIWMGLDWNFQSHACQSSDPRVKEQTSACWTIETETRRLKAEETSRGREAATNVKDQELQRRCEEMERRDTVRWFTARSSWSTSCHLISNPFIHRALFTNHCPGSPQAVVKRWFKSSPCVHPSQRGK